MLRKISLLTFLLSHSISCSSHTIHWQGEMKKHVTTYTKAFDDYRSKVCVPKAQEFFENYLKAYRGQGYWIPELNGDVDVESILSLIPEIEKKLIWIGDQKKLVIKNGIPKPSVTMGMRETIKDLLELKKSELSTDEEKKKNSRKKSLDLVQKLKQQYDNLIKKVSFLSNFRYPVDHLKNRRIHESFKDKDDVESVKIYNYVFLYRKILEDGAYNKAHQLPDIFLRTTIDTLYFELLSHDFYLSEDARYDAEFVLNKIESELSKGKDRIVERLTEWEERTQRALDFYRSLTLPQNKLAQKNSSGLTPNQLLVIEHNKAAQDLKEFVYRKQAEVYEHWHNQPELLKAIFVLETILLNEVGGVDGDEALERMDVARVVMNRLDKPKYLSIGPKDYIFPYLKKNVSEFYLKNERWLNALFKQGEFSFTYFYMSGVANIFCPDMSPKARTLRRKNVEIALQVLKEENNSFKATRYFSRASMVGRIHMDAIWEDYEPIPERPGLLAQGQKSLLNSFNKGNFTFLYSFKDLNGDYFNVLEIEGNNYVLGNKNNTSIFYQFRNPHNFRYFTKRD